MRRVVETAGQDGDVTRSRHGPDSVRHGQEVASQIPTPAGVQENRPVCSHHGAASGRVGYLRPRLASGEEATGPSLKPGPNSVQIVGSTSTCLTPWDMDSQTLSIAGQRLIG